MTLYDYIKKSTDWEITVWDDVYDVEVYFYKPDDYKNLDLWDKSMVELSKLLEVFAISKSGITVKLSKLIEDNFDKLKKKNIFQIWATVDDIMEDMNSILSGNVSDKWLSDFVFTLKDSTQELTINDIERRLNDGLDRTPEEHQICLNWLTEYMTANDMSLTELDNLCWEDSNWIFDQIFN